MDSTDNQDGGPPRLQSAETLKAFMLKKSTKSNLNL